MGSSTPEPRSPARSLKGVTAHPWSLVNNALGEHGATLVSYHVDAITGGSDAGVRINVRVERNGAGLTSSAVGTDIVLASAEAYRKALNVLL